MKAKLRFAQLVLGFLVLNGIVLFAAACMTPAERAHTRQETRIEERTEHRMDHRRDRDDD